MVRDNAAGTVPAICKNTVDELEVERAIGVLVTDCQRLLLRHCNQKQTRTATAVARFATDDAGMYPIVKLPLGLSSHPSGGDELGAMPISTACA